MFYKYDIVHTTVNSEMRYIVRRKSWFGMGRKYYYDSAAPHRKWKKFDDVFFQERLRANYYGQFNKDTAVEEFMLVSGLKRLTEKVEAVVNKHLLREKEKSLKVYGE